MMSEAKVIEEIDGLYKIICLKPFRKTPGVAFNIVPKDIFPKIDSIDQVLHKHNAQSPGPVAGVDRPWYMHPHQADNLIVMHGIRHVDLYSVKHGKVERFEVAPDYIKRNGKLVYDGHAMLIWPTYVFHRIITGEDGSASLNFASHYKGFDIKTNFSIYDLNEDSGDYKVIRQGFEDQF